MTFIVENQTTLIPSTQKLSDLDYFLIEITNQAVREDPLPTYHSQV